MPDSEILGRADSRHAGCLPSPCARLAFRVQHAERREQGLRVVGVVDVVAQVPQHHLLEGVERDQPVAGPRFGAGVPVASASDSRAGPSRTGISLSLDADSSADLLGPDLRGFQPGPSQRRSLESKLQIARARRDKRPVRRAAAMGTRSFPEGPRGSLQTPPGTALMLLAQRTEGQRAD